MPQALRSLLLAGASGLIGHQVLSQALAAAPAMAVHALVRRVPAAADARASWRVVDFRHLGDLPAADAALCALGTTIKAAGSQAAFRAVDFDAVLSFAHAARQAGVHRLAVVSALGANANSTVFYNRVKAEMESALQGLGFGRLIIARPSLLVGDRAARGQPVRLGERLGLAVSRPLAPLIPAAWRPVEAAVVARALLRALADSRDGTRIIESAQLQRDGRKDGQP